MFRAIRHSLAIVPLAAAVIATLALPAAASQSAASQSAASHSAPTQPIPNAGLSDPIPASSSTPAPPPNEFTPPPCQAGACLPWVWYQATKVINNNELLPIPAFGASMDNNTPDAAMLTDAVQGQVQASAQLQAQIPGSALGPGAIASAIGQLTPQVAGQVTVSTTKTVQIKVRPHDQGVILFGVPGVLVEGYYHTRDVFGHVTSTPVKAWAPAYPAVFGFNAYTQALTGTGPKSEVPVIPIPTP